jgi:isocitrate dehydrogenase
VEPGQPTDGQVTVDAANGTRPWTSGLRYRGMFEQHSRCRRFAENLERVCVDTVQSGDVTRDLAILIRADHPWLTTISFSTNLTRTLPRRWRKTRSGGKNGGDAAQHSG